MHILGADSVYHFTSCRFVCMYFSYMCEVGKCEWSVVIAKEKTNLFIPDTEKATSLKPVIVLSHVS